MFQVTLNVTIFYYSFSRQSNIDIEEEEGSSNTQKWVEELDRDHLSTTPMKLSFESSLEVQTPQRYTRGSSLEPIHPWRYNIIVGP